MWYKNHFQTRKFQKIPVKILEIKTKIKSNKDRLKLEIYVEKLIYQKKKVTASFDFPSEIDMEPSRPTFIVDLRLSETQGRYDILKSQLNSI